MLGIKANNGATVCGLPGQCFPGMAVDYFEGCRQASFKNEFLVLGARRMPGRTPHQPVTTCLHGTARTTLAQIAEQIVNTGVGHGQHLHIHHRIGKAAGKQHITVVVHVGKALGMHIAVRKTGTQFLQGIRTKSGKHQQPADIKNAMHLAKCR